MASGHKHFGMITSGSCPHCTAWRSRAFSKRFNGEVEELPIERGKTRQIAEQLKVRHVPQCVVRARTGRWRKCSPDEEKQAGLEA